MASPTQGSTYENIEIVPNTGGKSTKLTVKCQYFQFFENLTSPCFTAIMKIATTGDDVAGQGLYNGIPIKGGERVKIHITTPIEMQREKTPGIFEIDMFVNKMTNYMQDKQMETFILHLISKEGMINLNRRVVEKYKATKISDIIKDLLKKIKCEDDGIDIIEETAKTYNFIGNMRKPLTIAPMLAKRAIPATSSGDGQGVVSAGFFLWQTTKGMRFRSVESLIKDEKPSETYWYNRQNEALENPEKSFTKILSYTVDNGDIIASQRGGEYSTYRIYFDPNTFKFTKPDDAVFAQEENVQETLGSDDEKCPPPIANKLFAKPEMAHRIVTSVYATGCLEPKSVGIAATTINMDETEDVGQAITRYKSLFTQIVTIQVPVNVSLNAGDIIKCMFPEVAGDNKTDYTQSGLYIIKEISHFFGRNESYTAMKIVRDTSGI